MLKRLRLKVLIIIILSSLLRNCLSCDDCLAEWSMAEGKERPSRAKDGGRPVMTSIVITTVEYARQLEKWGLQMRIFN